MSISVVCSWPLQTDWTKIRPDKMSGLIWIQSVWHSDGIPERIFRKVYFENNRQRTKKHEKFPRGQRVNFFCMIWVLSLVQVLEFFAIFLWRILSLAKYKTIMNADRVDIVPKMFLMKMHRYRRSLSNCSQSIYCLVSSSSAFWLFSRCHSYLQLSQEPKYKCFPFYSTKTYVMVAKMEWLNEQILLRSQNIHVLWWSNNKCNLENILWTLTKHWRLSWDNQSQLFKGLLTVIDLSVTIFEDMVDCYLRYPATILFL